ncbi:MAG: cation:proton antiporter [bacterium]|nr:cation:proton antiporter [bacterium]
MPITLPIHDPVIIFAIVMIIVLVAPILMEKIKLPGIIGLIFAGILFGPHLFGILEKDRAIDLLGMIGLLYIMFLAGLEIDLNYVRKNKHYSLLFGIITFLIPLILGTVAGFYFLDLKFGAALLLASMFSSHTLITFPIVSRLGLSKKRSVTATIGGTILTDTLAFLVLAIVIASHHGELSFLFWVKLGILSIVYVLVIIIFLPKIGGWFFRNFSTESGIEEYVFVITALFISAFLSHLIGLEPIIGAFLAGLTLNSLIPEKSTLMNRIQFVGNSLFIPFFLISVGMLIDPFLLFSDLNTLKISFLMVFIAIMSKHIASNFFGRLVNFNQTEKGLIFGMSVNQAAATLAAVIVGRRLGIFNDAILTGTILMIIITCFLGSVLTQKYSRELVRDIKDTIDTSKGTEIDRILIPIKKFANLNNLISLAFLLQSKSNHEPLYLLHIVMGGKNEEEQIIEGEAILTKAVVMANAVQKQVVPLTKIDVNVSSAISKAIAEQRISKVILGWNENKNFTYTIFDTVLEQLVRATNKMIFIPRIIHPANLTKRIFLILPPLINQQEGFKRNILAMKEFYAAISAKLTIISEENTSKEITPCLKDIGVSVDFVNIQSWKKITEQLKNKVGENDMLIQFISRKGKPAWRNLFDRMPFQLKQSFPENNIIVIYPYYSSDDQEFDKKYFSQHPEILRTIPENNFFFNLTDNDPENIFRKIISINTYPNDRVIYNELVSVINEYPIELTPDIMLIHIRTEQVTESQIFFAVNRKGFTMKNSESKPRIMITFISPKNQPPQAHLNTLSEISRMVLMENIVDNLIKADDYLQFLKFFKT